jgi:hypothetical protein
MNPDHPLRTHAGWNGVSASWDTSEEWKNYLMDHGFEREAEMISNNNSTLEDFWVGKPFLLLVVADLLAAISFA